jgi:hypothetical protein
VSSDGILVPVHQLSSVTQVAKADLDYTLDGQRIDLAGFDEE